MFYLSIVFENILGLQIDLNNQPKIVCDKILKKTKQIFFLFYHLAELHSGQSKQVKKMWNKSMNLMFYGQSSFSSVSLLFFYYLLLRSKVKTG